jgi:hypothetical protein
MGQQEVLEFLKEERLKSDNWFKVKDIKQGLIAKGHTKNYVRGVPSDLLRLACFNQIQVRGIGAWRHHKEFRGYKKLNGRL